VRFSKPNGLNQKKGISSIVGGIFFLVLMTSGFTVYYVALDSQSQMLDTQQIIADNEVAKIREKFVVAASSSGVNNLLSLQVLNTGNNPIEIADVWIINKTDAAEPAAKYDVKYRDASIPVGHNGNILSNTPLYLISDIYDIKVISSIGTIQTVEYDVAGGSNVLSAQMIAIPQDVRYGENVTIALVVTNVGQTNTITDVNGNTATLSVSPNQCDDPPNPIFTGPASLSPSQSIMFFWDCVLNQPTGNLITITGNATGKLLGVNIYSNDATDSVIVRDFIPGGDEIVLREDLFGKPGIFMVLPSPFGWTPTGEKGLWGMNIVNPTSQNMWVNKAVLSLVITRDNESPSLPDQIFKTGSCSPNGIVPPTDTWACTTDNQLKWEPSPGGQHLIPPQSVQQFLTVADEGDLSTDDSLDTILVTGSVFTTFGQFAKSGYGTAFQKSGLNNFPLVNVYLTRDQLNPLNPPDIHTTELGMNSGTPKTFYAVLADFDPDNTKFIKNDISRLIINIPPTWTLNSYSSDHFTIPVPLTNPDGSIQIIGTLDDVIDGEGILANRLVAGIIEFNVTPPPVSSNKMYVMHILADGYTDADFLIGPIAEVVLQVVP